MVTNLLRCAQSWLLLRKSWRPSRALNHNRSKSVRTATATGWQNGPVVEPCETFKFKRLSGIAQRTNLSYIHSMDGMWFTITFIVSVPLAHWGAITVKNTHVAAQNHLLDKCRGLFVIGLHTLGTSDKDTTKEILKRIRFYEYLWQFGNSRLFRLSKCLSASCVAAALYVGFRLLGFLSTHQLNELPNRWQVFAIFAGTGLFHGLLAYFSAWTNNPYAIDDCGDRLEGALNAGHDISIAQGSTGTSPNSDGLTAHEIFGVGPLVTGAELARIRRRLVRQYHPDRWHNAGTTVRNAAEDAIKRVNAAYDELAPLAA